MVAMLAAFPASARPGDKIENRPYADLKRWHLGFSVGAHVQDLSFTHNGYLSEDGQRWVAEVPGFSPGFCVNVLADLRLHRYFNLRLSPGMYFGSKTVEMADYNSDLRATQDVKSAYVTVPIDLKVSGDRMRNARPYVTLGGMATFDVSKKRSEALMFNTADAYLCVGMGVDLYLPFFKLNPEIKFCFGLTDILRHDRPDLIDDPLTFRMTQSLSKVKSNMVVLTFNFE
ncbi:MAG: PorT family protein [Muribaculaceae bacterium]|nr:PorT family protein [Muribaculaceae bacterium]MDE6533399.1 PorT family protein [Muribaculaceae bacterium]